MEAATWLCGQRRAVQLRNASLTAAQFVAAGAFYCTQLCVAAGIALGIGAVMYAALYARIVPRADHIYPLHFRHKATDEISAAELLGGPLQPVNFAPPPGAVGGASVAASDPASAVAAAPPGDATLLAWMWGVMWHAQAADGGGAAATAQPGGRRPSPVGGRLTAQPPSFAPAVAVADLLNPSTSQWTAGALADHPLGAGDAAARRVYSGGLFSWDTQLASAPPVLRPGEHYEVEVSLHVAGTAANALLEAVSVQVDLLTALPERWEQANKQQHQQQRAGGAAVAAVDATAATATVTDGNSGDGDAEPLACGMSVDAAGKQVAIPCPEGGGPQREEQPAAAKPPSSVTGSDSAAADSDEAALSQRERDARAIARQQPQIAAVTGAARKIAPAVSGHAGSGYASHVTSLARCERTVLVSIDAGKAVDDGSSGTAGSGRSFLGRLFFWPLDLAAWCWGTAWGVARWFFGSLRSLASHAVWILLGNADYSDDPLAAVSDTGASTGQTITFRCFEGFRESGTHPTRGVRVVVEGIPRADAGGSVDAMTAMAAAVANAAAGSAGRAGITAMQQHHLLMGVGRATLQARMRGLSWFMYHWLVPMAVIGITAAAACVFACCCLPACVTLHTSLSADKTPGFGLPLGIAGALAKPGFGMLQELTNEEVDGAAPASSKPPVSNSRAFGGSQQAPSSGFVGDVFDYGFQHDDDDDDGGGATSSNFASSSGTVSRAQTPSRTRKVAAAALAPAASEQPADASELVSASGAGRMQAVDAHSSAVMVSSGGGACDIDTIMEQVVAPVAPVESSAGAASAAAAAEEPTAPPPQPDGDAETARHVAAPAEAADSAPGARKASSASSSGFEVLDHEDDDGRHQEEERGVGTAGAGTGTPVAADSGRAGPPPAADVRTAAGNPVRQRRQA